MSAMRPASPKHLGVVPPSRISLPLDLEPNESVRVPIYVLLPGRPGLWAIDLRIVQGGALFRHGSLRTAIEVVERNSVRPPRTTPDE